MNSISLAGSWIKSKSSAPFPISDSMLYPKRDNTDSPVYVVTGFLDAGKTTLLNTMLNRRLARGAKLLLLQFELGEEEPECTTTQGTLDILRFPIQELQSDPHPVSKKIYDFLLTHDPDEIWIEWNGMLPFSLIQTLFPPVFHGITGTPGDFGRLSKVLYLADAEQLEQWMAMTASISLDQIANSDLVVVRNFDSSAQFNRLKRVIRDISPGVTVLPLKPADIEQAWQIHRRPSVFFYLGLVLLYGLLWAAMGLQESPMDTVVNVFLGIMLQAVPFLLIGILLSSAIQIFVSPQFVERWFPKHLLGGILFALLAGFCLPVCDCASIPVFRSLIRKGIPTPSAITFMAAAPIINPVVILSTWYAFHGNLKLVLCRVGLGILCSVLVGLSFVKTDLLQWEQPSGLSLPICACGCYNETPPNGPLGKLYLCLRHAQAEFFQVGGYLMLGAFVSAFCQTFSGVLPWSNGGDGLLLPLLIMMGMAFFLSLCSSSDAVVARSFAGYFPTGALMAFLVFGPMMDVKNLILLSGSMPKRILIRLALTMFLVCAIVIYGIFQFGLGEMLL